MHPKHVLVLAAALVGVGLTGFFLLDGGDGPALASYATAQGGDQPGPVDAAQAGSASAEAMERTQGELSGDAGLPPVVQAALAVSGRVTDPLGNAIAGARVRVQYRQSFGQGGPGGFGRGGNGANANSGQGGQGAQAGQGGPAGQGAQRGRRGFGPGQEATAAQRQQFEAMRERFRPKDAAEVVVTRGDGSFQLAGEAYSVASLTIAVSHEQYAPTVERREWQSAMGALKVADIVLHPGVVVTGTVVDDGEQAVAGAEVAFEVVQNDNDPFAPQGRGNNGPGGRGNNGRGGQGRGGRAGWRDPLEELIGVAVTDATGSFRLGPIPAEPFQLLATAEAHLDGHSREFQPADGQQLPPVRIVTVAAAGLAGVVRDGSGKPVANARITGEASREAMAAAFRAQRDANAAAQAGTPAQAQPGQGQQPGQGRQGQRGRGGNNGAPGQPGGGVAFANMREVMQASETTRSNDKGEFEFKKLPRGQVKLTAEHPRFLSTTQEPVDTLATPTVVMVMPDALTASGVVVDAHTGKPIENFGIAANRLDAPADPNQGFGRNGNGNGNGNGGQPAPGQGQQGGRGNRGAQGAGAQAGNGTPAPSAGNGGGGNRGGNRRGNGQVDPQQVAQEAARAAQEAARTAWLTAQLGPAGRMPGRTPSPTAHAGGTFTVDGLQVGEYGFDVEAPGYVRTATVAVKVEGKVTGLVLQMEPGTVLRGHVETVDHTPVEAAMVELLLPDPPAEIGAVDQGRGGQGRGGPGGFGGRGGSRLARASSDAKGNFELAPVRQGTFRLRVQKQGLIDFEDPAVVLPAPGQVREVLVTMVAGGIVAGVVRNLEQGVTTRVQLTHLTDRSRHSGTIDALTGEYRIEGLPAGGYLATLSQFGGDEEARRTALANSVVQREKKTPDLVVAAGATVRYDMIAGQDALGAVVGSVFLDNTPSVGSQVRLERVANPMASPAPPQAGGGRGNRFEDIAQQLLHATVAADGSFKITAVPPGSYTLVVEPRGGGQGGPGGQAQGGPGGGGRGGFGGRGGSLPTHRQPIEIPAYSQQRVQVDLHTSDVEIRVGLPEAIASTARVRVSVALASEVGTTAPQDWRRLPSFKTFGLRNGTTGAQKLAPGFYRYQVAGRGIVALTGDLAVALGQPTLLTLTAVAAPETPNDPQNPQNGATPGGAPNNGGRGGRGGRGGAGQPGGQPGTQPGTQPGGQPGGNRGG